MHKGVEILLWGIVLLILAAPIAYGVWCSPEPAYWDSVASGLLATAAALIGGIPVALAIDRAVKRKAEKFRLNTERQKEIELLELLKGELEFCDSMLTHRKEKPDNLHIQPLKSNLWHAISAAGKLNHISDPKLLDDFSSVYYLIDTVRNIEQQGYKAARGATVSFSSGGTATEHLWRDARSFDEMLTKVIAEALVAINKALEVSQPRGRSASKPGAIPAPHKPHALPPT